MSSVRQRFFIQRAVDPNLMGSWWASSLVQPLTKSLLGGVLCLLFCLSSAQSFAETASERLKIPDLISPVMDTAQILEPQTAENMERALRALNESSGTQITFLSLATLGDQTIEEVGIQAADKWKLGVKGKAGRSDEKLDRGVILIVAVKEHKLRIEVGRALEASLTDLQSKRIINEKMAPLFKAGRMSDGVLVGVFEIAHVTDPDVDLTPYLQGQRQRHSASREHGIPIGQIIFIILIIIISIARLGGGRGSSIGFWGGGFGGGGFGGGSGGGGGWSGGGGGFNGGGASGDW